MREIRLSYACAMRIPFGSVSICITACAVLMTGCATQSTPAPAPPEAARARIAALLPANLADRPGWALDIYAAFDALRIEPSVANVCSVLAVTEQESTYRVDPPVPGLGKIARAEIDRRAERVGVPRLLVQAALQARSPDSRTWSERIEAARTEKELSNLFDELIDQVPLGQRLLAGYNPVQTGGPMQVSINFGEIHAKAQAYPYRVVGSIRDEVFTRRGGLYFGIAHLLGYPASYDQPIYRFADFNAGQYASRNAAFQRAVSTLAGVPLDLDGDLVTHGADAAKTSATEAAVRSLGPRLRMNNSEIRRALESAGQASFEETRLWTRVFELGDAAAQRPLPRALIPRIQLKSPKITRSLTTEWFARRVDERHQRCQAKGV